MRSAQHRIAEGRRPGVPPELHRPGRRSPREIFLVGIHHQSLRAVEVAGLGVELRQGEPVVETGGADVEDVEFVAGGLQEPGLQQDPRSRQLPGRQRSLPTLDFQRGRLAGPQRRARRRAPAVVGERKLAGDLAEGLGRALVAGSLGSPSVPVASP